MPAIRVSPSHHYHTSSLAHAGVLAFIIMAATEPATMDPAMIRLSILLNLDIKDPEGEAEKQARQAYDAAVRRKDDKKSTKSLFKEWKALFEEVRHMTITLL